MQSPPSICTSVCPSVSTWSFKLIDLWPWSFAGVWVTTIAHKRLKLKVTGQGQDVVGLTSIIISHNTKKAKYYSWFLHKTSKKCNRIQKSKKNSEKITDISLFYALNGKFPQSYHYACSIELQYCHCKGKHPHLVWWNFSRIWAGIPSREGHQESRPPRPRRPSLLARLCRWHSTHTVWQHSNWQKSFSFIYHF